MNFTLVGTGNMAWFLGKKLSEAGWICKGVFGRSPEAAAELADFLNAPVYSDLKKIPDDSDCCIMAVSDAAIEEKAKELNLYKTVVIHTSGTVPINVLPFENRAVLWFIYSISKKNLPEHKNVPAVYEGSGFIAEKITSEIAGVVSDNIFKASERQRQWLHLNAVITNNFINHLLALSQELCKEESVPFELLKPIIRQTVENAEKHAPASIQTGPAIRNDQNTLQKHLSLLKNHPRLKAVYKIFSASIRDFSKDPKS